MPFSSFDESLQPRGMLAEKTFDVRVNLISKRDRERERKKKEASNYIRIIIILGCRRRNALVNRTGLNKLHRSTLSNSHGYKRCVFC